jgi:type II secretory pathway pseudopilin PulG
MRQAGFTIIDILVALILIGVCAAAVVSLVSNSSSLVRDQSAVAAQNNKVRSAMALIQRDLSEATKPLGFRDTSISNPNGTSGSCLPNSPNAESPGLVKLCAPAGNEIIFQRSHELPPSPDFPDGRRIYYGERIAYNGPSATPALRNTITVQAVRSSTPFWNMDDIDSPSSPPTTPPAPPGVSIRARIKNAPARVILDKVPEPDVTNPLFAYYKDAITPATTDPKSIGLVEVNLRRDEDLGEGVSQAAALANEVFPTASLSTSVFLKRIGTF